jgi:hypothetical protein
VTPRWRWKARRVKRSIRHETVDRLHRWMARMSEAGWRDARCLFVLSTGRTGTATLWHILALSPEIDARHEPSPQLMVARKRARTGVRQNPDLYWATFARARGHALLASKRRGRIYAETSARMTFFAPVLAERLPGAHFVYIHRDPAAIIRSGMERRWYDGHPADPARIEPVAGEDGFAEWCAWEPFDKICWYWDAYNRFALDFVESVGPARALTLRAEDLFSGEAVPAIFDLLRVPVPERIAVRRELEKRHNAQPGRSFPPPEDWDEERRRVLLSLAGDTMDRLGYPTTPTGG